MLAWAAYLAVNIPDEYATVILAATVTAMVSLVAFLFKQTTRAAEAQARSDIAMATVAANLDAMDARVSSLERRFERSPWEPRARKPRGGE